MMGNTEIRHTIFSRQPMNKNSVRELALQAAFLSDGSHVLTVEQFKYPAVIATLTADAIEASNIARALRYDLRGQSHKD